jgi:hypothetical protein
MPPTLVTATHITENYPTRERFRRRFQSVAVVDRRHFALSALAEPLDQPLPKLFAPPELLPVASVQARLVRLFS